MSVPRWRRCDGCGVFIPASLGQQVRPRTRRYPPWICEACRIAAQRSLPQTLPQT